MADLSNTSTVYLLGAGASRGYYRSLAGVHPPLATNYFSTFSKLGISADFEVKIGYIVNYIRDTRGIEPTAQPTDFDESVELVFAELDRKLQTAFDVATWGKRERGEELLLQLSLAKAYDQFIFWFSHVLNEIQNGDPCPIYSKLVERSSSTDAFVTFNWDTLLDRALAATGRWYPDDGYFVRFEQFLDKKWRGAHAVRSELPLLKLHGSTNWFGPYVTRDFRDGSRKWVATPQTVNKHWCLIDGTKRYDTYKDRWRPGYQPYSYFFPPNDPYDQHPLMPILIPPSETKRFHEYGAIFRPLWNEASSRLNKAQRLVIIGYSFPLTDSHAFSLLESFVPTRSSEKVIEIIDPFPEAIEQRVRFHLGNRCQILVHKATLAEYLGIPVVQLKEEEGESARIDRGEESPRQLDGRQEHILDTLVQLNLSGGCFDLTTYSGRRLLDCTLPGEFATHLMGHHRKLAYEYRLENIPIKPAEGAEVQVPIWDIWIVWPLPAHKLTEEDLASVNLALADDHLREMIRKSYHCNDDRELDHFLRRYLAT